MTSLRRNFIKQLGWLLVGGVVRLKGTSVATHEAKLTTLKVAGLQHGECSDAMFKPGEVLRLVPEPSNPHDPYAVAIVKGDKHAGYVPRTNSRVIASLLRNGICLRVTVRYFKPDQKPWGRLWVSVWMVKDG